MPDSESKPSGSTWRVSPGDGREWYADGLRFSCTQCGNCCTGPPGAVWFSPDEGRAMAEQLKVTQEEFHERFARKIDERWSLNERQTEHGFDCVFLDRQSVPGKAICSVYQARPTQCRTWPFWPENLRARRTWETVKRVTPCPGMNSGKLVPLQQIRIQRDANSR